MLFFPRMAWAFLLFVSCLFFFFPLVGILLGLVRSGMGWYSVLGGWVGLGRIESEYIELVRVLELELVSVLEKASPEYYSHSHRLSHHKHPS